MADQISPENPRPGETAGEPANRPASDPGKTPDVQESGAFKAANALFVAAALIFVWSIVAVITNLAYSPQVMMLNLLESGMLTVLGFLCRKKPFTSLIIGLFLFMALWAVTAAMDSSNIYSGIIIKIFVIIYLARALPSARSFERNN
jgi:hypothetical protein